MKRKKNHSPLEQGLFGRVWEEKFRSVPAASVNRALELRYDAFWKVEAN